MGSARFHTRAYAADDRDACLSIFDSNVPDFFGTHERQIFAAFLDNLPGPYLIIEEEGVVVACGGYAPHRTEPQTMTLCWGMVSMRRHQIGLGRLLLRVRLDRLAGIARYAVLNTSQFSSGFFTAMGFETRLITKDGFSLGMDLYEMAIAIPEDEAGQ